MKISDQDPKLDGITQEQSNKVSMVIMQSWSKRRCWSKETKFGCGA